MTNIIIELLRAVVTGVTLLALIRGQRSHEIRDLEGWRVLLFGFALIFFGTLIDITDNFTGLNRFVVFGDTPVQAILEKMVGYLLGFMLLSIGVWRWLPKIIEHQKMITGKLEKAKDQVNTLHGLLPICSSCRNIRDDKG